MKKAILLFFLVCSLSAPAISLSSDSLNGGSRRGSNTLFLQVGGESVLYSLNIEHLFHLSEKRKISLRLGMGLSFSPVTPIIPITISGIAGKKRCFEYGLGTTLIPGDTDPVAITAVLGFRYFASKGFMFRAGLAILYTPGGWIDFPFPWPGISAGYSFR